MLLPAAIVRMGGDFDVTRRALMRAPEKRLYTSSSGCRGRGEDLFYEVIVASLALPVYINSSAIVRSKGKPNKVDFRAFTACH
jgi:hypothetical protein